MIRLQVPKEIDEIRARARRAIAPLKPADDHTKAAKDFLFTARPTNAGRRLPPYYLIYFLLVDLLEYPNLGRFEKVAWSVPVDLDGTAFLIEDRSGVGIFAHNPDSEEEQAQRIVNLIKKAVKVAKPYFRLVADEAVRESKLNVVNNSRSLYQRYVYFRDSFKSTFEEAEAQKAEWAWFMTKAMYDTPTPYNYSDAEFAVPKDSKLQISVWLALAAIDAFFSWTEHIFIHLAILKGNITTGTEVTELARQEWAAKFKKALNINDPSIKKFFDQLLTIHRQLRNFMVHGAFGKQGEAFSFHSTVGAVPVAFEQSNKRAFSFTLKSPFDNGEAIKTIEQFIAHMWSGPEAPARIYLQEFALPVILTMARRLIPLVPVRLGMVRSGNGIA